MSAILNKIHENLSKTSLKKDKIYKGKISRFDGKIAECSGFPSPIGTICKINCSDDKFVTGEIIGFKDGRNLLAIHDLNANVISGAPVEVVENGFYINVSDKLLGRVINAQGKAIDGSKPIEISENYWPITGKSVNPMNKEPINEPLDVGIKAINSLLTVGRGQRLGIIAGSGVGKSILLSMMTKFTSADVRLHLQM